MRKHASGQALAVTAMCAVLLGTASGSSPAKPAENLARQAVELASPEAFGIFLDRLMVAESGGRSAAKSPHSSALGPFQFIKSTFLDITRRHFATETAGLNETEILSLRTDRDLSRRAATIFCKENAKYLHDRGHEPTFSHLRLAFLLGATDAARIIGAREETPVMEVLSSSVVSANPFMRSMSVGDLLEKSERDLSEDRPIITANSHRERPSPRAQPSLAQAIKEEKREFDCRLRGCRKVSALPKTNKTARKS